MSGSFELHPQLAKDCLRLGELSLCSLLLMNNKHFPWAVLVPRRMNMVEWYDLTVEDQARSLAEINWVSKCFKDLFNAKKMNIAMLGNQVPQMHIHVIARFEQDAAWPNPVWGTVTQPYEQAQAKALITRIRMMMKL